jgi:hypothetical protein
MTRRDLRIAFADLPPRPARLTREELRSMFGGCNGLGGACMDPKDCCDDAKCLSDVIHGRCCRDDGRGIYQCFE